eukprot:4738452-Pleurochrysis_carterae.AAC.1
MRVRVRQPPGACVRVVLPVLRAERNQSTMRSTLDAPASTAEVIRAAKAVRAAAAVLLVRRVLVPFALLLLILVFRISLLLRRHEGERWEGARNGKVTLRSERPTDERSNESPPFCGCGCDCACEDWACGRSRCGVQRVGVRVGAGAFTPFPAGAAAEYARCGVPATPVRPRARTDGGGEWAD